MNYTYCDERAEVTPRELLASGKFNVLMHEITSGRLSVTPPALPVVRIPDRFKPEYLTLDRGQL